MQRLTPDRSVDFDIVNVRGLPTLNIIDYLQGRVPGLQIMRYVDTIRFGYHGTNTFIEGKDGHAINPPLIYVDESHVDFDEIEHISLTNIALIRFVPPPVWFAPLNGGNTGAIMVYTKNYKDGSVGVKPAKKLQKGYGFDSFTVLRTFPILDYSQKPPTDEPDFRNTLYWNPEIKLNDQGQFSLIFYNSDDAKKIHLVIQGMDVNGNLAFDEQTL